MKIKDIVLGNIAIHIKSNSKLPWEISEDDIEIMQRNPDSYILIEDFKKTNEEMLRDKAIEILSKHWLERTGKEIDDTILAHLDYTIDAIIEHSQSIQSELDKAKEEIEYQKSGYQTLKDYLKSEDILTAIVVIKNENKALRQKYDTLKQKADRLSDSVQLFIASDGSLSDKNMFCDMVNYKEYLKETESGNGVS